MTIIKFTSSHFNDLHFLENYTKPLCFVFRLHGILPSQKGLNALAFFDCFKLGFSPTPNLGRKLGRLNTIWLNF